MRSMISKSFMLANPNMRAQCADTLIEGLMHKCCDLVSKPANMAKLKAAHDEWGSLLVTIDNHLFVVQEMVARKGDPLQYHIQVTELVNGEVNKSIGHGYVYHAELESGIFRGSVS